MSDAYAKEWESYRVHVTTMLKSHTRYIDDLRDRTAKQETALTKMAEHVQAIDTHGPRGGQRTETEERTGWGVIFNATTIPWIIVAVCVLAIVLLVLGYPGIIGAKEGAS